MKSNPHLQANANFHLFQANPLTRQFEDGTNKTKYLSLINRLAGAWGNKTTYQGSQKGGKAQCKFGCTISSTRVRNQGVILH